MIHLYLMVGLLFSATVFAIPAASMTPSTQPDLKVVKPFAGTMDNTATAHSVLTAEQTSRAQTEQQNLDLLTERQKLRIQIEDLQTQVSVLKNDRSNEGIRTGAIAVFAGVLLGWFLGRNQRNSW